MPKYHKCPRCELNYITEEEEYCPVCKAELGIGPELKFAIDEDDGSEDSAGLDRKLCPICKKKYISIEEEMCDDCKNVDSYEADSSEIDIDKDEKWKEFMDDEDNNEEDADKAESSEEVALSKLVEEESKEYFKDDEEEDIEYEGNNDEPDDFPEFDGVEGDLSDDDEDEDEDDDEDEEPFPENKDDLE